MATIKLKFRASSVEQKTGSVYYQIIHDRVARQINPGYKIFPQEWDHEAARIVPPNDDCSRSVYLATLNRQISEDIRRLHNIISRLEHSDPVFTADRVVELYRTSIDDRGFLRFARNLVDRLKQIGKEQTAETYTSTLNSFERFRGEQGDIPLDEIESNLMVSYETYLKSTGVCPNSSSYYMRNLRAIYNRAVEEELIASRFPFKHVYTGIDKTVKRAVPLQMIRRIRDLDLTFSPATDFARDLFMFSFYTRGMSFVDMAYLRKRDLQNGVLSYRRQKTNQQLFIKWEKPMQAIVDKYDTNESPYLLPILRENGTNTRKQYKNAAHLINRKLKTIGQLLNSPVPLTMYVARHAWASIAKSKNISVSVISEAMGHDSESTTRIYLASLDTSIVDKANSLILNLL